MGVLIELIVVGAIFWWLYRCVIDPWRTRRTGSTVTGAHDAGVWVNPVRWAEIIVELEEDAGDRRRGGGRGVS
ncbi:hypothetical protein [Spongiactinospora sp. TRM90649]|uniref:hypothetical protein n=1 Tax=Spongiactinospora sp. TRM90649 TaxID=3031114 RepID=UPI0023F83C83|nr:hypothetical protein [Spongiactinospora sp. TRM90649]MDF5756911.1 hypothetical protein [Spongiactinospora sp. TRM90649]